MGKFLLPGALVGVGLGLAVISIIVGFVVVPNIIDSEIEKTTQLRNESDTWDDWIVNPVPVYLKFYIWNVTNPNETQNSKFKVKPNLSEKGPYVFSEIRLKHVQKINVTDDTVTYHQNITYTFVEELSKDANGNQLTLNDMVNVINLPFIAITTTIASMNVGPLGELIYRIYKSQGETFIKQNVPVGQVLFDGWEYPAIYDTLLSLSGDDRPAQFTDSKFGFYNGKNNTNDGEYVIKTGLKNSADFGRIISWANSSKLHWWGNPSDESQADKYPDPKYCNQINGTDGGVFPPFLTKETRLPIFTTEICRSVIAEFAEEAEHKGITGYKYEFPESFYQHPDENPQNYCFCPSPEDTDLENSCARGIIRLFSCQGGPFVTSAPHFYNGDERFSSKIDGLKPNKDDHDTFLLLQPDSGFPLKIRKRLQISMEIQNFKNTFHKDFNDIEYFMFPALWASEETELNDELADEMKSMLLTPMKIVDISKWVGMGIGALVAIAGIILIVRRRSYNQHGIKAI